MKVKKSYIVILLVGFLFIVNIYFPSWLVIGDYVSHVPDSFASYGISHNEYLKIYDNGTFKSDTWGEGRWNLEYNLTETRISFETNNEIIYTYFYRPYFIGKPRIVIFRDLGSEFRKT